ncbi:MAG TPA: type II toxin-antitoxin system RelE/ParE family toxin [Gaiellaceae bacterium]|nr:type II toxin-antitoxin system RelE/ParE family toxin [Gaiellaceae bacterium]
MPGRRRRPRDAPKRRWRDYRTAAGNSPVARFLDELDDDDVAEILAAMAGVRKQGLSAAKHLEGEIWEIKADGHQQSFRVLFAPEGEHKQVLLALEGFSKKTEKTPPSLIRLATRRLADWRARARGG